MSWQTIASYRNDPKSVKGKRLDREQIRRVWTFAKGYRKAIYWYMAVLVLSAVAGAIPPLLVRQLIDRGIGNGGNWGIVVWLSIGGVFVAIANASLALFMRYYSAKIGEGLIYDLRVALFNHIQRQPLSFFTRTQTGSLMSRLNNDVIGAQLAVTSTLSTVVSNVITLAVTLTVMLRLEWRLTLITLIILPLFIFPARKVGQKMQAATRESMNLNSSMNTTIVERFNVSGALIVKLFGRPKDETESFAKRARRVADIGIQQAMYSRILFAALGLISAIGAAVVYLIGGRLALDGVITSGTVIAFVIYVDQIYSPLTQLTNARVDVLSAMVSFERVFEILDFQPLIKEIENPKTLENAKGRVVYDHVSFTHPPVGLVTLPSLEEDNPNQASDEEDEILHDISFIVEPGETIALVGPSGAGKTTTAMMLARMYDTTKGSVSIDGVDVKELSFESIKNTIGVVTQDPHLFHDSIGMNLSYAKPDATLEEMIDAAKRAQIHNLINSLPDKYDTLVGERGYRLSGGEKQRLAIARVLLKNPSIVILDEATSHLDSETEGMIQVAFEEALKQRSAIVIAHRLSTVINADKIIVLEDGHIVEVGKHDELIAKGGLYSELYKIQIR